MLRDVAPTMNKVSHRMGAVQGGHEGNIPVAGHVLLYVPCQIVLGIWASGIWWDLGGSGGTGSCVKLVG